MQIWNLHKILPFFHVSHIKIGQAILASCSNEYLLIMLISILISIISVSHSCVTWEPLVRFRNNKFLIAKKFIFWPYANLCKLGDYMNYMYITCAEPPKDWVCQIPLHWHYLLKSYANTAHHYLVTLHPIPSLDIPLHSVPFHVSWSNSPISRPVETDTQSSGLQAHMVQISACVVNFTGTWLSPHILKFRLTPSPVTLSNHGTFPLTTSLLAYSKPGDQLIRTEDCLPVIWRDSSPALYCMRLIQVAGIIICPELPVIGNTGRIISPTWRVNRLPRQQSWNPKPWYSIRLHSVSLHSLHTDGEKTYVLLQSYVYF